MLDYEPIPKTHILSVIQKFMMAFLLNAKPMTLEFISKTIHGLMLAPEVQISKSRRLYDVSNGKIFVRT